MVGKRRALRLAGLSSEILSVFGHDAPVHSSTFRRNIGSVANGSAGKRSKVSLRGASHDNAFFKHDFSLLWRDAQLTPASSVTVLNNLSAQSS